jgi:ADP-ribose pyrophosphatase YjhB (NUDIX family)
VSKPLKRSVAVVVRRDEDVLCVRRADNDDELPGIWGLPAGTCRAGESVAEVISRIGRDKLGAGLTPERLLCQGAQERPRYILEMELWEARLTGTPDHPEWKWALPNVLREGASRGSLCCRLALGEEGGWRPPEKTKAAPAS